MRDLLTLRLALQRLDATYHDRLLVVECGVDPWEPLDLLGSLETRDPLLLDRLVSLGPDRLRYWFPDAPAAGGFALTTNPHPVTPRRP